MLVERSYLVVKEGLEEEFEAAMAKTGIPLLEGVDGAEDVRFGRGIESPDKFVLLIEWRDMDAHESFRESPSYAPFRTLLSPFVKGGSMEHFEMR